MTSSSVLLLPLLVALVGAIGTDPYCSYNKSSVRSTPVEKTRVIVQRPKWFWKKSRTIVEHYIEMENHIEWKMISACCEGYTKNENSSICEPACEQGCPKNSKCVEPNRCQCDQGYIAAVSTRNGSHHCEPICDQSCPTHGRCAQPNVCECERGYRVEKDGDRELCVSHCPPGYHYSADSCQPLCELGNGCRNGTCVDHNVCICNVGLSFNPETKNCERKECNEDTGCETADHETVEDNDFFNNFDLDENETIYLSTPTPASGDYDVSLSSESSVPQCPHGNRFVHGECRSEIFPSNEVDCRVKACAENARCLTNGTCACVDGFVWHKWQNGTQELATSPANVMLVCISLEQATRISASQEDDDNDNTAIFAVFLALGVLCVMAVVTFLAVKLLCREHGRMDVEAKHDDLCCHYESENLSDKPMMVY